MMRADGHFAWGSVMYGYLIYDTAFTAAFYGAVGSPSFLVHHALGLACCCFGLYFNKCAAKAQDWNAPCCCIGSCSRACASPAARALIMSAAAAGVAKLR